MKNRIFSSALALFILPLALAAQETDKNPSGEGWSFKTTAYFWMQGIHGDVNALGRTVGFKDSPQDLASHANFGLQGVFEAQYNRLILVSDHLWTPVTFTRTREDISATVKFTPVILTQEAGYRLIDAPNIKIDGFAGARYWHLGANLTVTPSPGTDGLSKSTNWTDPIAGARIQVPISSRLEATVWGDTGGFGVGATSDYQVVGGLGYRLSPKFTLDTAWRYLYAEHSQDSFRSRMAESGLLLGVTYKIK